MSELQDILSAGQCPECKRLKAELKQANAVVEAAKKFRDNNDFYNIGPWTDVEIALAALETDDE